MEFRNEFINNNNIKLLPRLYFLPILNDKLMVFICLSMSNISSVGSIRLITGFFWNKESEKTNTVCSAIQKKHTDRIAISGLFIYSVQVCKPELSVKTQTVRFFAVLLIEYSVSVAIRIVCDITVPGEDEEKRLKQHRWLSEFCKRNSSRKCF